MECWPREVRNLISSVPLSTLPVPAPDPEPDTIWLFPVLVVEVTSDLPVISVVIEVEAGRGFGDAGGEETVETVEEEGGEDGGALGA